jgi:hypothetical protein
MAASLNEFQALTAVSVPAAEATEVCWLGQLLAVEEGGPVPRALRTNELGRAEEVVACW